jgi:diguanylate cyclase (GGDEF)-like protein
MTNHSCGGKTCAFCRALDRHWEKRSGDVRIKPDEQLVKRSWEVQSANQLEFTKASLASRNLEEMEVYVLLDKLTGLYNSRSLERELRQEVQRAQRTKKPLTLCMIAIKGLDDYSKTNGSLAGDSLLALVASTLKRTIREIDIGCKYSSERFAVILPETNQDGAHIAAARYRRTIYASLSNAYGTNHPFTVSIALASYPVNARKAEELLDQASKALSYTMLQDGSFIGQAAAVV